MTRFLLITSVLAAGWGFSSPQCSLAIFRIEVANIFRAQKWNREPKARLSNNNHRELQALMKVNRDHSNIAVRAIQQMGYPERNARDIVHRLPVIAAMMVSGRDLFFDYKRGDFESNGRRRSTSSGATQSSPRPQAMYRGLFGLTLDDYNRGERSEASSDPAVWMSSDKEHARSYAQHARDQPGVLVKFLIPGFLLRRVDPFESYVLRDEIETLEPFIVDVEAVSPKPSHHDEREYRDWD